MSSFCSAKATHIFSAKNIRILCIESTKTVNEMTLNELIKLTTLWTTGPLYIKWIVYICWFFLYLQIDFTMAHLMSDKYSSRNRGKNLRWVGGGWGVGGLGEARCRVSYVTGASNIYWLTVGQGLLFLQQVRVVGECLYFFCSFTFIHFPFSPVPLFYLLYYLFYISSPFLWETTQNDPQGLTCR